MRVYFNNNVYAYSFGRNRYIRPKGMDISLWERGDENGVKHRGIRITPIRRNELLARCEIEISVEDLSNFIANLQEMQKRCG